MNRRKSQRRATARDVARRVGVHASTVSRVLNPATRDVISDEIARRVTRAAAALGYRLDPFASGLRTHRSRMVGVLVPDIANPVFPPMIRGLEDTFGEAGYTAIVANTDNHKGRERVILEDMFARRVDGVVLATAWRRDPLVERCVAEHVPVVLINRAVDSSSVSSVVNDDAFGIHLIVRHLLECGHARIGYLAGPLTLSTGYTRHHAFLDALTAAGLPSNQRRVFVCNAFSESEGVRGFLELWGRNRSLTAIVAANDMLALGCYDGARELGLRIPDDVAVTGFNDMPFVDKLHPPLTTIRIPHYQMGAQAARILLAQLRNRDAPVEHVTLRPELVARESTAQVKGAPQASRAARAVRRPLDARSRPTIAVSGSS